MNNKIIFEALMNVSAFIMPKVKKGYRMNIPGKVKIGNLDYEVVQTENNLVFEGESVDGMITFEESKIELGILNKSKQFIEETFIHEVVHGILNHMCMEQNEEVVDKISKGLHQVIKDNPDIFIEKSVGGLDQSYGEKSNGIRLTKHPMCNHLLKRDQFIKDKLYIEKCSFLTVAAELYVKGMEDGFANLDGFNYPYIKDSKTDKVYLIKPDTVYIIINSITQNNPIGDRLALTKDEFDRKYEKIV